MENKILEVLDYARGNALSKEDIYKKCGYSNVSYEEFLEYLKQLISDKQIYCVNSNIGMYTLNPFKEGIFHIKRNGDCYVDVEGRDVTIKSLNKFNCMDKDRVRVRITDFNSYEGTIKEIVERHGIIAELKTINGKRYAVVGDTSYVVEDNLDLVDGMIVKIVIADKKVDNYYKAKVDTVIGHKNSPKIEELKILSDFEFPMDFTKKTYEELKTIPNVIDETDIVNRVDLRDKMIFTIDGDDTKDIDDAISIDVLPDGCYKIGIHIADVSFYVKENSAIDLDARERGTSVYMPGIVAPMYPPKLSNGICSLNPEIDRFAISCDITINSKGEVIDAVPYKSVIRSRKQMTYENVNSILEKGIVPSGYEIYADTLRLMKKVSDILNTRYVSRGKLDFDSDEVKIAKEFPDLKNDQAKIMSITKRVSGAGETLIENYMLLANEAVATYLMNAGVYSIYRDHDGLDSEKLERLKTTLSIIKSYGCKAVFKPDYRSPKYIQTIINKLKSDKNFDIYSSMILRCMAKADYETENIGHFGLGVNAQKKEAYTHFTSPIRRYPDTIIHRILSTYLSGDIDRLYSDEFLGLLKNIAQTSSEREIASDKCEREANKMDMALYMKDYIGEEYTGRITGFTFNGMFVELPNFVEGRLGFEAMDDFYKYDPELEIIVGQRNHKVYRLGDKIKIKVVRSDPDSREIDFELPNVDVKKRRRGNKYGNTK